MYLIRYFVVFVFCSFQAFSQTVPKLGNDTLLDISCWNVEWFGNTSNGPSDEALQYNNVKSLVLQTDFDLIAMEEISDINTYNNFAAEATIAAKYETYISTFSAAQKMALFWKKNMFEVIGVNTLNILTSENYNFASRPPLQVCLKTKGGTKTDTLFVIVLHMKAQTESDDAGRYASYTRRQGAATALKNYVEQTLAAKKFVIIGDWNDDLDKSIYNAFPTPYLQLLNAGYQFPTKELTDAGKKSYAFGSAMIDHIMHAKTLDSFYYVNSARVFDLAGNYISNFSNNTSDHYPVYAFYNWKKLTTYVPPAYTAPVVAVEPTIRLRPNPATTTVTVNASFEMHEIQLFDVQGREVLRSASSTLDLHEIEKGFYFVGVNGQRSFAARLLVE